MFIDPRYLLFVGPAMLLAIWASMRVKSTFAHASQYSPANSLTGAEVAHSILRSHGIEDKVGIEMARGVLSDHYDPQARMLRLSPDVYNGRNLAAFGVAAHEVGHAIQHATNYSLLGLRNAIVPVASFGSNASYFVFFFGLIMQLPALVMAGILLFSAVVAFQVINLPVEFDASARAKQILVSQGFISPEENKIVSKVLSAAALTYVAGTLTSIMTLLYYLSFLQNRD